MKYELIYRLELKMKDTDNSVETIYVLVKDKTDTRGIIALLDEESNTFRYVEEVNINYFIRLSCVINSIISNTGEPMSEENEIYLSTKYLNLPFEVWDMLVISKDEEEYEYDLHIDKEHLEMDKDRLSVFKLSDLGNMLEKLMIEDTDDIIISTKLANIITRPEECMTKEIRLLGVTEKGELVDDYLYKTPVEGELKNNLDITDKFIYVNKEGIMFSLDNIVYLMTKVKISVSKRERGIKIGNVYYQLAIPIGID